MMYFVFNRESLQLEEIVATPKDNPSEFPFFVLPGEEQDSFRKTLDRLRVSQLEVALMYRNTGNIVGPVSHYRDSLISYLFYLLTTGKPLTRHTVTLFNDEAPAAQAGTGPAPVAAAATVQARVPSAPRGGNRVTIFEVADRMWNEAGSPRDLSIVLPLRKTIMAELEANHGIKKTTSSTALGEWQKLRLNN
jgi:hypothetical protein